MDEEESRIDATYLKSEDDFVENNKLISELRIVGSDKCGAQCPALSVRNLISKVSWWLRSSLLNILL